MTEAESIIISLSCRRSKINTVKELAKRCGIPYSTLRDKMANPGQIRLSDLKALDPYCGFKDDRDSLVLLLECIGKN